MNDDEKVKSFLNPYPCVLVCKENPDTECIKDHYHCLIKTEIKLSTFRARLKVHFGKDFAGNKHYSIKSIKDDENIKAIRYLCKGLSKTREPLILINTYDINVEENHKEYWEINEAIKYETKEKPKELCIKYITEKYTTDPTPTILPSGRAIHKPKPYKDVHGFSTDIVPKTFICNEMVDWYSSRGYTLPHKTTGTMIILQCMYNIYPPSMRNSILQEYYIPFSQN